MENSNKRNVVHNGPKSKTRATSPDGSCELLLGNCFAILPTIADQSIDCVITDPPYGVTDNAWDKAPPMPRLWEQLRRVLKPGGIVAMFCQQPFTTAVITSNRKHWRYELVWHKPRPTGFLNANRQPLRAHEHVQIFCDKPSISTYNPQMGVGKPYVGRLRKPSSNYRHFRTGLVTNNDGSRYPRSVIEFPNRCHKGGHPTQKPVALLQWLIATFSNPGDVVLDPYVGSGTTLHACLNEGRRGVGIEMNTSYFEMACRRINA